MTVETIQLQIAYGAVKHFGRNLYTSNPPAIAELIANSWDAYSSRCDVYYSESSALGEECKESGKINSDEVDNGTSILIFDNGIGMTDDELVNRYALSGTEKKIEEIRIPNNTQRRPYMGRKGIGKFAAFSLGDTYVLFTKSEEDKYWKKMTFNYNDLYVNEPLIVIKVEELSSLEELIDVFPLLENYIPETGTAIYIPRLRRKITEASIKGMKRLLARRFSVNIVSRHGFNLNINSEPFDLKKQFYDEFLEFVYYFGMEEESIKGRFPQLNENNFKKISESFFEENQIRGWLVTVELPKNLMVDNDISVSGVVVYINGKLADEDILKDKLRNKISSAYLLGEVNADSLQENEDPVLSSREGLNREFKSVQDLIYYLDVLRKRIDSEWNGLRAQRQLEKQDYLGKVFEANSNLRIIYESYSDENKEKVSRLLQRVFDGPEKYESVEYSVYGNAIFGLVNSNEIKQITINGSDPTEEIRAQIFKVFDKAEINAALRIMSNIEDRLEVINKLKILIESEDIESAFEQHLSANPWLINQYWDKPADEIVIETQKTYSDYIEKNKRTGRTDIILRVSDEPLPIICELKRDKKTSYSAPSIIEIIGQINKYRECIARENEHLKRINDLYDIKAYFICGDKAYNDLKNEKWALSQLDTNKINLETYQMLVERAERVYRHRVKYDIVKGNGKKGK